MIDIKIGLMMVLFMQTISVIIILYQTSEVCRG